MYMEHRVCYFLTEIGLGMIVFKMSKIFIHAFWNNIKIEFFGFLRIHIHK